MSKGMKPYLFFVAFLEIFSLLLFQSNLHIFGSVEFFNRLFFQFFAPCLIFFFTPKLEDFL